MCFVQSFLGFIDFMLYKLTKKETYTWFYIFHWLIFFSFSTCFLYIKKFYLIETFYVGKIKTFPHREGLLLALYLAVEENGNVGCTLYHFILGPSRLMTCPLCHFSRHINKSLWLSFFRTSKSSYLFGFFKSTSVCQVPGSEPETSTKVYITKPFEYDDSISLSRTYARGFVCFF